MSKLFKFQISKISFILAICLCILGVTSIGCTKALAYGISPYMEITEIGDAKNISASSSYEHWQTSNMQTKGAKDTFNINTSDVAIRFATYGSFDEATVNLDGKYIGRTDGLYSNGRIYFYDSQTSFGRHYKTFILKNVPSGKHKIQVLDCEMANTNVHTDYVNVNVK